MARKHIDISSAAECCGCMACQSACPKGCIAMVPDKLGFAYPTVDESKCVDCGVCVRTCPLINVYEPQCLQKSYAAVNLSNSDRLDSSSGGVFISLAREVIRRDGVVFGAVFTENWAVRHVSAATIEEVLPMMGSKYLQSEIGNTYKEAGKYLKKGRLVLFTGTPCQIAGLRHFLIKDYSNLITVEVICHGVPAPGVWQSYLKEYLARLKGGRGGKNTVLTPPSINIKKTAIAGISFRNKRLGWKKFGFDLLLDSACGVEKNSVLTSSINQVSVYEPFIQNEFMKAFLRNWSLRPSCYSCKAKNGSSSADITIGDFWGIEKHDIIEDDDQGVSCIVCRTPKGMSFIEECRNNLKLVEAPYSVIRQGNPSIEESVKLTATAEKFQRIFPKKGFYKTMHSIENPPLWYRGLEFVKRQLRKL